MKREEAFPPTDRPSNQKHWKRWRPGWFYGRKRESNVQKNRQKQEKKPAPDAARSRRIHTTCLETLPYFLVSASSSCRLKKTTTKIPTKQAHTQLLIIGLLHSFTPGVALRLETSATKQRPPRMDSDSGDSPLFDFGKKKKGNTKARYG